jgi:hypothetical protein
MTTFNWKFNLISDVLNIPNDAIWQCNTMSTDATIMFILGTTSDGNVILMMFDTNIGMKKWKNITPPNIEPSINNYGLACDPTGRFLIFSSEQSVYAANLSVSPIIFNSQNFYNYVGGVSIAYYPGYVYPMIPYMYVNVRYEPNRLTFKNEIFVSTDLFLSYFSLELRINTASNYVPGGQIGYVASALTSPYIYVTNYVNTLNIFPNSRSSSQFINIDAPALINCDASGINSILGIMTNPSSVVISSNIGSTYIKIPLTSAKGNPVIAISNDGNFMLTCAKSSSGKDTDSQIYIQNSLDFDGTTTVFTNTNSPMLQWTCCSISNGNTHVRAGKFPVILAGTNGKGLYIGFLVSVPP